MNTAGQKMQTGKLTVFLGAVAGVGKTYAMLEAGYDKYMQGVDVVVGCIDIPKRAESAALLSKIPAVTKKDTGIQAKDDIAELDVEAILEREPQLVIIDNLAHLNKKTHRHSFRYQDIQELLDRGIDVYSTMDIFHVESLKDIVKQITGIKGQQTVPDGFIEKAELILIDISQNELIQRIKDWGIILPQDFGQDSEVFFRPGNINALRELALRYTAQRVDKQLNEYMQAHDIQGPWPASERILACISPSPFSTQVIRTAKRMASAMKVEWAVVYVETNWHSPQNEAVYNQLEKNLRLAEELGAEVITLCGEDIAHEILLLTKRKNVTQIVLGKPLHSKIWDRKDSVVDRILQGSQGISVHIIPGKDINKEKQPIKAYRSIRQWSLFPYALTVIFVVLITFLNKLIGFDLTNIALLYFLPVLFSGAYWGSGPSIMASLLGVLAFDIFFVPPINSITVSDLRYLVSFVVFLIVAVTTGTMANRLRHQAELARRREARTAALYSLSRKIVAETELDGILKTVVNVVSENINGDVVILIPNDHAKLCIKASNQEVSDDSLEIDEIKVANWVYEHGRIGGSGTENWTGAKGIYFPMKTEEKSLGVLGIRTSDAEFLLSSEHRQLLEAFANLLALSMISLQLSAEAQQARNLAQSEKLRIALFNSISHELRTPLASILGAVTSLLEGGDIYNQTDRQFLLQTVNEGALRMNRLVGNLLDMARLESGMMQLKYDWCDIQEIIGVALRRIQEYIGERIIKVEVMQSLPLVKADFVLIEQVIINLLDNAHKYSTPGTEISIIIRMMEKEIRIEIKNIGEPIVESEKEKIFDKFYRRKATQQISGTGLGLSICKGIIEAHGGKIWVTSTDLGENNFIFTLPLDDILPPQVPAKEGDRFAG